MIGAIAGDIIGSAFEFSNIKREDFPLFGPNSTFTDDTILTVAVADSILNNKDYAKILKEYGRKYPGRGYGAMFSKWLESDGFHPYNSFGNGSAARVSPVGFAFDTIERVLEEARKSAEATHNHPEGIRGAQCVAVAIFLARKGQHKEEIRGYIQKYFYDLSKTLAEIKSGYRFDETCQGSVPQAIIAFLESNDYEDAIRKAISLGGDADSIACITGGIAQAYYKSIPDDIIKKFRERLLSKLGNTVNSFLGKYKL